MAMPIGLAEKIHSRPSNHPKRSSGKRIPQPLCTRCQGHQVSGVFFGLPSTLCGLCEALHDSDDLAP